MPAKPNKTQETALSVDDFIAGVEPEAKRADAATLREIMQRITGEPARMWGPGIVGFGVRHYKYESGREGDICRIGFSPRKAALTLYLLAYGLDDPEVQALGKITHGKGCLYIKQLADVDLGRLEALIARGWRTGR